MCRSEQSSSAKRLQAAEFVLFYSFVKLKWNILFASFEILRH